MHHLLSLIGSTPLVEITKISVNPRVRILAKLEMFNPGGSIKDRVALAMVERAERLKELGPGKTVIEATSGNTGIGLAMVCAVKGYPLQLIMSSAASEERKKIMRAYGAGIILTPGHLSTDGAIEEAYRMAREEPEKYVLMDQFNNPASIDAHYQTTGREIWDQTRGGVTHVAVCLGTTGTVMGITRRMRETASHVQCLGIEPYPGHKIQGLKNMQESYPPGIYNKKALDSVLHVSDEDAFEMCRLLARKEGLLAGMSSGAALAGALQLSRQMDEGCVVTVFPDSGERYLSTPLFKVPEQEGARLFDLKTRKKKLFQAGSSAQVLLTIGPRTSFPDDPDFWRRAVFLDVISRYLSFKGNRPVPAVAVADFDDVSLETVRETGTNMSGFSSRVVSLLKNLSSRMNMLEGFRYIPASRHFEDCVKICTSLLSRGLAYEKLRSVYFDVGRDRDYGTLAGVDPQTIMSGKTVDLEDYVKDSPRDFTLFKRASLKDLKEDNVLKTRWGNVRPSWYLQMAASVPEGRLDLVLGGETHFFPHLDNLKSIWQGSGKSEPQCWMVAQSVKSEHKEDSLPGLESMVADRLNYFALRGWLLSVSYHKTLVYSAQSLTMWAKNQHRVQDLCSILKSHARPESGEAGDKVKKLCTELTEKLFQCVENDLAIYQFWPHLFAFCKNIRRLDDDGQVSSDHAELCLDALKTVDQVLGIVDWQNLPLSRDEYTRELAAMVEKRELARAEQDFALADELRAGIAELGYRVEDVRTGTRVYMLHNYNLES